MLKNKMCGRDSIQDYKIQKILKFKNRKKEECLCDKNTRFITIYLMENI